jgi:hypothetical protein
MISITGSSSINSGGSISFNGSSQYLAIASNAAFSFGTSDFTIETWIYPNSLSGRLWFFDSNSDNVDLNGNGGIFYYNAGLYSSATNTVISVGTWHHIALVRASGTVTLYVNGSSVMSQAGIGFNSSSNRAMEIAYSSSQGNGYFNGLMTNFRVVKGTAVYTSAFTPSTIPLTAITNTQLLLNVTGSGTLVTDSSTNNLTVTNTGSATYSSTTPLVNFAGGGIKITGGVRIIEEFNPVVTTGLQLYLDAGNASSYPGSGTAWTDLSGNSRDGTLTNGPTYSATNGGSIVFDGTNDYVQCTGSLTVTAATFVTWIRRNGNQGQYDGILFSRGTNTTGMNFQASNQLGYHWNDAGNTYNWQSGLTIPDATWCMIAVSVTSTSATAYLCQTGGTTTATNTVNHASSVLNDIKLALDDAASRYFNGNIAIAQLYNVALSAGQISTNFEADRGRFGV